MSEKIVTQGSGCKRTLGGVVEADPLDSVADNLLVVKLGRSGDLTQNHNHTGLGSRL